MVARRCFNNTLQKKTEKKFKVIKLTQKSLPHGGGGTRKRDGEGFLYSPSQSPPAPALPKGEPFIIP